MTWLNGRSLELQLAVRLAALYVVATIVAIAALLYQAYSTAESLSDLDLRRRATELAALVAPAEDGKPRLALPSKLANAYASAGETFFFAVRSSDGAVIAASNPEVDNIVAGWPKAGDEASYFRLEQFGRTSQNYHGLTMRAESSAGPLSITVARATDESELVHSVLREFVFDIAWTIPLIVGATLAIGVLAIRRGLSPLRRVSAQAAAIDPARISIRLPEKNLPSEVRPLVEAVNLALDRLEKGFAVQRQFTANAAHELRTPLAIIAAALDGFEATDQLAKLKADVARMSRLVEQLLRVARLDASALDVSDTVDLSAVVAEVVAAMAPLAVARKISLGARGADQSVKIQGNRYAVEDALRNLVENAFNHAPVHTEIIVEVRADGTVSVADRGCGVSLEDRGRIFDRFWRGKDRRGSGAGLGLSIVKEIMKAHRGSVLVDDNPGGGAVFELHFPGSA